MWQRAKTTEKGYPKNNTEIYQFFRAVVRSIAIRHWYQHWHRHRNTTTLKLSYLTFYTILSLIASSLPPLPSISSGFCYFFSFFLFLFRQTAINRLSTDKRMISHLICQLLRIRWQWMMKKKKKIGESLSKQQYKKEKRGEDKQSL